MVQLQVAVKYVRKDKQSAWIRVSECYKFM